MLTAEKMASPNMPKRFQRTTDDEINEFIQKQRNKNTLRKTACDVGLFQKFISSEGIRTDIEYIPRSTLDELLARFILSVRKINGSEFEPTSLRSILSSIDRYLNEKNYGASINFDRDFSKTRMTLKAKQKQLKSLGKGSKNNAAQPLSDKDIQDLWENGQLGASSPESIINTMWLFTTMGFGLRGSQEHHSMCWGDIKLEKDEEGDEYLVFNERQTKTRQGDDTTDIRKIQPKLWANKQNKNRCPVEVYKKYSLRRPGNFSKPEDPFYVATSTRFTGTVNEKWFLRLPIGVNKLNTIMKRMAVTLETGENRKLTNHSARKTLLQNLADKNVHPTDIIQISGHKNIQSVLNYSNLNKNKHKRVSSLIYPDTNPKQQKLSVKNETLTSYFQENEQPDLVVNPSRIPSQNLETSQEIAESTIEYPNFDLGFDVNNFLSNDGFLRNFITGGTNNTINVTVNLNINSNDRQT